MGYNVDTAYISEKINKIRWKPNIFNAESTNFVTGSWDNEINTIKLWQFVNNEEFLELCPYAIKAVNFIGDVTELQFLNDSQFLASSTIGDITLFAITTSETDEIMIDVRSTWKGLHHFDTGYECSCTSFALNDTDVASVGEDGRIKMFNINRPDITDSIDKADSCTISCTGFLKHNELLTANTRGLMKLWDLRDPSNPSTTFPLASSNAIAATALAFHPTQRHLVVAGDEDGFLTVWDLRSGTFPVNYVTAHAEYVSEIRFHPEKHEQMFSCSGAGELWHWSTNYKQGLMDDQQEKSWLLTAGATTEKMEVCELMPTLHTGINSFDLNRGKVLCSANNEAVYLVNHVDRKSVV